MHLEITKAKLLIKVPKNPFVIKTTITAKIVQYYLYNTMSIEQIIVRQTRWCEHIDYDTFQDTYKLISRDMSSGYEGGWCVLSQWGWNF